MPPSTFERNDRFSSPALPPTLFELPNLNRPVESTPTSANPESTHATTAPAGDDPGPAASAVAAGTAVASVVAPVANATDLGHSQISSATTHRTHPEVAAEQNSGDHRPSAIEPIRTVAGPIGGAASSAASTTTSFGTAAAAMVASNKTVLVVLAIVIGAGYLTGRSRREANQQMASDPQLAPPSSDVALTTGVATSTLPGDDAIDVYFQPSDPTASASNGSTSATTGPNVPLGTIDFSVALGTPTATDMTASAGPPEPETSKPTPSELAAGGYPTTATPSHPEFTVAAVQAVSAKTQSMSGPGASASPSPDASKTPPPSSPYRMTRTPRPVDDWVRFHPSTR